MSAEEYGHVEELDAVQKPTSAVESRVRHLVAHRTVFAACGRLLSLEFRSVAMGNGERVIDDAEIDGVTGAALDSKETEPGPLLLQGDHGKVTYRNIKIRPLPAR